MHAVDRFPSSFWVNVRHYTSGIKPFFPHRKSSTAPDSVAMTVLTRNRPSPVIQVTVKQTETDPGLIGVSDLLLMLVNRSRMLLGKRPFMLNKVCFVLLKLQECHKKDSKNTEGK